MYTKNLKWKWDRNSLTTPQTKACFILSECGDPATPKTTDLHFLHHLIGTSEVRSTSGEVVTIQQILHPLAHSIFQSHF